MDPTRATREEFSSRFINMPLPGEAADNWKDLFSKLQQLFEKLTYHDGMRSNLQQTYMFQRDKETWRDAISRTKIACDLILNTTPGMLDMMMQPTSSGQNSTQPEFGEEILEIARSLKARNYEVR